MFEKILNYLVIIFSIILLCSYNDCCQHFYKFETIIIYTIIHLSSNVVGRF